MGSSDSSDASETAFLWSCVLGLAALLATLVAGHSLEARRIRQLSTAAVGLLVGAGCAGVARLEMIESQLSEQMIAHERFSFDFFVIWLLPPIIFEAGFNMDVPAFGANIGPTLFLAFVGTTLSSGIVGGIVWYAGQLGYCYPLGPLASLTFGSIISATDPVSVLAVFKAIGVDIDLFSVIFGESVLNDAVAIVLSRTFLGFNSPEANVDAFSVLSALLLFCIDFLGSMAIGVIYGVLCSLLTKWLDLRRSRLEEAMYLSVALCGLVPWASYYTAEALELSGIVTILFCGMVMSVYTRDNLGDEAAQLASRAFKCVAMVSETFVFVYLGEALFSFPILHSTVWRLVGVALFACALGRLHVLVAAWLSHRSHRAWVPCFPRSGKPLSGGATLVLWWSGLRGGVSFALAAAGFARQDFAQHCGGLPRDGVPRHSAECVRYDGRGDTDMSDSLAILQTTLLVAAFSIFVLGGTVADMAVWAGVLSQADTPGSSNARLPWGDDEGVELIWRWEERHVRPWLTHPPPPSQLGEALDDENRNEGEGADEEDGGDDDRSPVAGQESFGCVQLSVMLLVPIAIVGVAVSSELASVCTDALIHHHLVVTSPSHPSRDAHPTLRRLREEHHRRPQGWRVRDATGEPVVATIFGEGDNDESTWWAWASEIAQLLGVREADVHSCAHFEWTTEKRLLSHEDDTMRPKRPLGARLEAQLRTCAQRGVVISNSTVVIVRLGQRMLQASGGETNSLNETMRKVAHALLTRRHSRRLEAAFDQVVNFSLTLCHSHGCPRALILSPPPLSASDPNIASLVLQPDAWLSRLSAAYVCVADAELAQLPLRMLAHAFGKVTLGMPFVLFSEAGAVELMEWLFPSNSPQWSGLNTRLISAKDGGLEAVANNSALASPYWTSQSRATLTACIMSAACAAHRSCAHALPATVTALASCDEALQQGHRDGFNVKLSALAQDWGETIGRDVSGFGLLENRWLLSTLLRILSYLHATTPTLAESLMPSNLELDDDNDDDGSTF